MEDHVPRHAQMGAWVLINDRWYQVPGFDRVTELGELGLDVHQPALGEAAAAVLATIGAASARAKPAAVIL